MEEVAFTDWQKLEIRVGKIVAVERLPRTEKLYKLQVDIGEEIPVQLVTSLVPYYTGEELQDQKIVVLVNLKPVKFSGEISRGMLLCAEKEDGSECVLLTVQKDIDVGTPVT